tara:strand:- start:1024 stop:3171 length:2148 start_codon:yes stop_codon:yes gene_type:complete
METDPNEAAHFRMTLELSDRGVLQSTFDMLNVDVVAWDAQSNIIVCANASAREAIKLTMRDVGRRTVYDLLPDLPKPRVERILKALRRRPKQEVAFHLPFKMASGERGLNRYVVRYVDGLRPTYVAFVQNITRYLEARTAARNAEAILKAALESLPDGFVLYDSDDKLVICNDRYREIYRDSAEAMRKGATFREILQFGLDRGQYSAAIGREAEWLKERMTAHRTANSTVEQHLSSGEWLRIVERSTAEHGRVGLRIDITELKKNEAKLEQNARTDYLTGLMNRRGLQEHLKVMSHELQDNERISVLHIDLDKFKSINDGFGHDAGDFILRHCAKVLRSMLPDDRLVARVGGDEFIGLVKSGDSTPKMLAFAQTLVSKLSEPVVFRDRVCDFSASIGIAFHSGDCDQNTEKSLTGADIALNAAKQAGRGVCRVFEDEMRRDTIRQISMGQEIRLGLKAGHLEPFFQPQVDTIAGKIIGFESLIRWRHPEKGLVPAGLFLPAAEGSGLMNDIDEVVMDRSCYAASQLKVWGVQNPCVSINMSMSQLRDPTILKRLMFYVESYDILPVNLRIELLESTLLDERSSVIVENVHRLIAHGFSVELDDFGTGHAAIATLRKFAVKRIKIDRSLVEGIDSDPELRVITGAIINLADRLGVSALAEGVETAQEQRALQELGCSDAQGYLHAHPMPLSDLQAWITAYQLAQPAEACPHALMSG